MSRRKTTSEFIGDSIKVHKNKYDYSLVEYIDSKTKVIIICPIHGKFEQAPGGHSSGQGCKKCGSNSSGMSKIKTQEEVIKQFKNTHSDRYDYSLVEYKRALSKVEIVCKDHGSFFQTPQKHYNGQGCPMCSRVKQGIKLRLTTDSFIDKASILHGSKYKYDKTVYVNQKEKVTIICPIHNEFKQSPGHHLMGKGCQKCSTIGKINRGKENPSGWSVSNWEKSALRSKHFDSFKVYIIKLYNENESFYKIGRTYRKTKERFRGIKYDYEILHEFIFDTAKEAFNYEGDLKRGHKEFKYLPKIKFNGKHECFSKINLHL